MREIKFRGWCFRNKRWEYGFYVNDVLYPDSRPSHRISPNNWEVDENSVGQYTGLKDKNGKEIYEGDIDKSLGVLKWLPFSCEYAFENADGISALTCSMNDQVEIIGNVYENPELIKN